jgi:ABC-type cobalamin transport system ATPase subunit
VLQDGKVLYAGSTSRVLKTNVLEQLYSVRFAVLKRRGRYWPVIQ